MPTIHHISLHNTQSIQCASLLLPSSPLARALSTLSPSLARVFSSLSPLLARALSNLSPLTTRAFSNLQSWLARAFSTPNEPSLAPDFLTTSQARNLERATQEGRLIIWGEDYTRVTKEGAQRRQQRDTEAIDSGGERGDTERQDIEQNRRTQQEKTKRGARRRHRARVRTRSNLT